MPLEIASDNYPIRGPRHDEVLYVSTFEDDEDIIEVIDEGILPCEPYLVFLKLSVMIVQALLVAFMRSLETFEPGFNDEVEGT